MKRRINIPDRDYRISPPAQNSKGDVFVAGEYDYATSGNTYLYRVNPDTGSVTKILTLPAGEFVGDYTVKVDDEDRIYARSNQKLYCVDAAGTLKWTFTTTPPPQLAGSRQGANIALSWSTNAAGFNLVSVTNLSSTNWTLVSPSPSVVNGQNFVTNSATGNAKFYRLRNP